MSNATITVVEAPATQLNIANNVTQIVKIVTEGPQGPRGLQGIPGEGVSDLSNYYTKTATDLLLAGKANSPIVVNDITDFDGTVMAGGTF